MQSATVLVQVTESFFFFALGRKPLSLLMTRNQHYHVFRTKEIVYIRAEVIQTV